jgi:hypothetical protein
VSRSLTRPQALLLGLVVLAGLAVAFWMVFRSGERQRLWSETAEIRAGFLSVNGIDRGTPVRVRGVEAGQVTAVELPVDGNPDGKVFLSLQIDKKFLPLIHADAKARLLNEGVLGGKIINIEPGKDREHPLKNGDEIGVVEAPDIAVAMQEAVQELRNGNGTINKLMKSPEAHDEAVALAKQSQQAVQEIRDAARGVKKLPLLRGYIDDANALLFRPDCDLDRRVFASAHLFEPGRAILTEQGKTHLNNLEPWLQSYRITGSEVVIVSYCSATPSMELSPAIADTLTQKQSEAVLNYMKDQMRIHRVGWFTGRKATPLGMGLNPPPLPEREPLPADRTEIQIFVPH